MPAGIYPHPIRASVEERFWSKVQKGDDCWEWQGSRNAKGYGGMKKGRRGEGFYKVHRLSFELAFGPIPDDLLVLHHCDNPPCVRPDHLWLGTASDNMRDMASKGRSARGKRASMQTAAFVAYLERHPGASRIEVVLATSCVNLKRRVSDARALGTNVVCIRRHDGRIGYLIESARPAPLSGSQESLAL